MIFSVNRWELPKRPMTLATIMQPSWYEYDALLLTSYIISSRSIPAQNGWCRIFKPKLGNSFRRPWQCKQQWTAEYYSATISCEGYFSDFSIGISSSSRFRAYGFSLSTCRVVLINPTCLMLSGALPGPCCNMLEWFINQQHVGSIACLHSPTYVSCSWDCNKPIENSIFLCFTFINNRSWDEISTFGPCNRFALQHASKTLFNMDPKSQVKTSKRSFPSEKETIGGGHLEKWYIMMNHKRNWDSDRNETAWGVEGRGDGVNIMLYLRNSTYGPIGQTIWQLQCFSQLVLSRWSSNDFSQAAPPKPFSDSLVAALAHRQRTAMMCFDPEP